MGLGSESVLGTIVHQGLHESLGRFFPSQAVIERPTYTTQPNGERVATWATLLTAPANLAQRFMTERRDGVMTRVPLGMALNLAGHYPTITIEDRVTVGGTVYNITAVNHDSLSASTRLDLERVTH